MTDGINDNGNGNRIGRRQMLARLGLAAGAAYMAPVMLSLSQARASGGSYSAPSAASFSAPSRGSSARSGGSRRGGSFSAPSAASRPGRRPMMTDAEWRRHMRRIFGGSR
ncbi:hypothetical protein EMQ25_15725 [Arsenicitalea aurantiaca]|uniref:Uncharacterized protein n=1 Tax=Arsenicitalea aurantiaca TaxID=1783274 RepID=A0A433X444_9HYPH|nr:hypothetical protein [Arsenicitalea aurantiaca]RUT28837.1 hypothetical protein EMQ25_15725 [Arsenicitalea aurantiaca]